MAKKPLLLISIVHLFICSIAPTDDSLISSDFKAILAENELSFTLPKNYKEIAVRETKDLYYAFAMKNKKADFEVRYSVWPLKKALEDYKKCQQDTDCFMLTPNVFYKGRAQSNVLNMTGGGKSDLKIFNPENVKKEFNADAGGTSFFEFKCDFGKGYKFGQMVYLHRENVADVIITFMSNNQKKHPELMKEVFHSLKFK